MVALVAVVALGVGSAVGVVEGSAAGEVGAGEAEDLVGGMEVGATEDTRNLFGFCCTVFCSL